MMHMHQLLLQLLIVMHRLIFFFGTFPFELSHIRRASGCPVHYVLVVGKQLILRSILIKFVSIKYWKGMNTRRV